MPKCERCPEAWFGVAETQLSLRGLTDERLRYYLVLGVLPLAILWQWCRRRKGTQAAEGHPLCQAGRSTRRDIYKKDNIKYVNSQKIVSILAFANLI